MISKLEGKSSALLVGLACSLVAFASGCKEVTEKVIETGVQAAKDASKGVDDGIDKGRKSGESVDGAVIVSSAQDLAGKGGIQVHAVRAAATDPKQAEVDIALENTTDKPLRFTKLEVIALDKEGFVKRPSAPPAELTVPAQAKEKVTLTFPAEAASLAKIRIWDKDADVPAPR